jgi:hypothetical protein
MGTDLGFWARFLVASLATWRISHLVAREDGPGDLVAKLRRRLGPGWTGRLMDCFYCLSLWVAAPMAFFVAASTPDRIVAWIALSGAACLLERAGRSDAIVMQRLSDEGDHR